MLYPSCFCWTVWSQMHFSNKFKRFQSTRQIPKRSHFRTYFFFLALGPVILQSSLILATFRNFSCSKFFDLVLLLSIMSLIWRKKCVTIFKDNDRHFICSKRKIWFEIPELRKSSPNPSNSWKRKVQNLTSLTTPVSDQVPKSKHSQIPNDLKI